MAFYDEAVDSVINPACPKFYAESYVWHFVRGARETLAELLLRTLAKRGFTVPDDVREEVRESDPQQLYEWFEAALVADSLEAIFEWEFDLEVEPGPLPTVANPC
ncbi:hypothetical protein [Nocardia sp. NPDC049149]|uniref:hypothetical protein n=1 Tax=Nocardia sp. NPDC049149 TaxID=3364315 RepID=UPI003714B1AC